MKWRILFLSLGVTILCIFIFSIASTQVYYQSTVDDSREFLSVYMNEYDPSLFPADEEGAAAFSERLNGARVTFMDQSGEVLADSESDTTENHADREEVQEALSVGEGFAVRDSATLSQNMAYYCRLYADAELLVRVSIAIDSNWQIFLNTLPTLASYLIVDLVLCVGLSFVATYFIVSPVTALAEEAAANNDVQTKYPELTPIAEILNERNRNIERQMREIQEEKNEVDKARKTKDEFIANVTHEMNTPLTSIRGYAELLGAGALTEDQKSLAYKTILSQSERLTNLIACIINYSEIDNDELPAYAVDFSAAAREMLEVLTPEAEQKGVRLIGEIDDNVVVLSRKERINEVLGNLTRNAIRYNKPGGSVTVTLRYRRLTVADTGVGIAEENKKKIFHRFFTVDSSHNGKNGGFGLGLAVVKKICDKSGWKISVESELGVGSTFIIDF